jgi:hypothetical protein
MDDDTELLTAGEARAIAWAAEDINALRHAARGIRSAAKKGLEYKLMEGEPWDKYSTVWKKLQRVLSEKGYHVRLLTRASGDATLIEWKEKA